MAECGHFASHVNNFVFEMQKCCVQPGVAIPNLGIWQISDSYETFSIIILLFTQTSYFTDKQLLSEA